MTEPVIARRCPKCGASIRVAASFCPQCGKALAQPAAEEVQHQVTPDTSQAKEATQENAVTLGDTVGEPGLKTGRTLR